MQAWVRRTPTTHAPCPASIPECRGCRSESAHRGLARRCLRAPTDRWPGTHARAARRLSSSDTTTFLYLDPCVRRGSVAAGCQARPDAGAGSQTTPVHRAGSPTRMTADRPTAAAVRPGCLSARWPAMLGSVQPAAVPPSHPPPRPPASHRGNWVPAGVAVFR